MVTRGPLGDLAWNDPICTINKKIFKCLILSKYCLQVFERLGVEYAAVELNTREDGPELQSALGQITGQNTVGSLKKF